METLSSPFLAITRVMVTAQESVWRVSEPWPAVARAAARSDHSGGKGSASFTENQGELTDTTEFSQLKWMFSSDSRKDYFLSRSLWEALAINRMGDPAIGKTARILFIRYRW